LGIIIYHLHHSLAVVVQAKKIISGSSADLFLGLLGKFVEVEHDMDSGQGSLVKCLITN
jgi:hypothetical protein